MTASARDESGAGRPRVTPAMLRDVSLFSNLDDETLTVLARELPTEHADIGTVVMREGDQARFMYVIVAGELEVTKLGRAGDVRVALFGPGDWFGEMAVLDVQPRSATVRAVAPTMLLRMSAEHVDALLFRRDIRAYALLVRNIARELARRLRVADGILSQMFTAVSDEYARPKQPRS